MSEKARQAYNAYMRAWRKNNKEKVKATNQRYWEKKLNEERKEA
ncbi:hypothetical protein [uncultured Clostridium sp.]|nr:hypothetical protein [uncultured Clostridium sp.]